MYVLCMTNGHAIPLDQNEIVNKTIDGKSFHASSNTIIKLFPFKNSNFRALFLPIHVHLFLFRDFRKIKIIVKMASLTFGQIRDFPSRVDDEDEFEEENPVKR